MEMCLLDVHDDDKEKKMIKQVAGYLQMPEQWFEEDAHSTNVRSFTVYRQGDTLVYPTELRVFWLDRIEPVYANFQGTPLEQQSLFDIYDTKSNPRRVHPFAHAYAEWVERVYAHVDHPLSEPAPMLTLKRFLWKLPSVLEFRKPFSTVDDDAVVFDYSLYDGLSSLVKIQAWWRKHLTRRKKVMDESV